MSAIFSEQFEKPKGFLGRIAGKIMAFDNRKINHWTLSKLGAQNGDCILEIGYGPGHCIQTLCKEKLNIHVHGVDISSTMYEEAKKRNEKYIQEGKVKLFKKDIARFNTNQIYDKIYSVNNYPLWEKRKRSLGKMYALLKTGGKVAITVQPREDDADSDKTHRLAKVISDELKSAGFTHVRVGFKKVRPVLTVCVTAMKIEK
ncbi:SAM-dependent methyltransferase [Falsibacillus albus]|uniref:Class I SAM-dependent methyltransferase n=1 Tax=Falsibacillus albus TaxID=2478915 RepID=A0A3L7JZ25_9BACI|nr:class I SAM-dependent methyltransferase [Falsibacillus albus]RLQ95379.1 class I SAM-dependent methyltransferase [Falsibacillus albus]